MKKRPRLTARRRIILTTLLEAEGEMLAADLRRAMKRRFASVKSTFDLMVAEGLLTTRMGTEMRSSHLGKRCGDILVKRQHTVECRFYAVTDFGRNLVGSSD